jgi:hypothetical protein
MGSGTREGEQLSMLTDTSCFRKTRRAKSRSDSSLTPVIRGFVKRAVLWSLAFGVAHLLGLRAYTSMLSGTSVPERLHIVLGMTYIVLYLGFVFLVPMLLIAAGLLKGGTRARRLWQRKRIPTTVSPGMYPTDTG